MKKCVKCKRVIPDPVLRDEHERCLSCAGSEAEENLPPRTTVIVELEIEGDPSDTRAAVESALDMGALQDAINDHLQEQCEIKAGYTGENEHPPRVVSATVRQ